MTPYPRPPEIDLATWRRAVTEVETWAESPGGYRITDWSDVERFSPYNPEVYAMARAAQVYGIQLAKAKQAAMLEAYEDECDEIREEIGAQPP